MTVSYNRNLGVFQINGRGAYTTREEAEAADAAGGNTTQVVDDDSFASSMGVKTPGVIAPPKPAAAPVYRDTRTAEQKAQDAFNRGNTGGAGGAYNMSGAETQAAFDKTHDANQGGVDWGKVGNTALDVGGFALDPIGGTARIAGAAVGGPAVGYLSQMATGPAGALVGSGNFIRDAATRGQTATNPPASSSAGGTVGGAPPAGTTQEQLNKAAGETQQAETRFNEEQGANAEESDTLFSGAMDRYDALSGANNGMSDEARGYQQEGLQQQRMLLEKLFDFDENQYAAQFGDQTLSRMIAAGRQGTSAAEQQAGRFAALEQAPAVYAEGRRQASELANQRLGMAQQAAASFGELGTMTRGQDETRAQFEAQLPLEIANSVSALTQGKMQLNQQESQMFGEMWMDFAQLQSIYGQMSSAEQIAWWKEESARRGQDKQFDAIMAQIKADGAVSDKDLVNGLFQLGGGLLGIGGRVAGAKAGAA
jgi:hypothetical protein